MLAVFATNLEATEHNPLFYRATEDSSELAKLQNLVNVPEFVPEWAFVATWGCVKSYRHADLVGSLYSGYEGLFNCSPSLVTHRLNKSALISVLSSS